MRKNLYTRLFPLNFESSNSRIILEIIFVRLSFYRWVPDSIFSSYDQYRNNLSSTSFKRSLDNLRKKKKKEKKERDPFRQVSTATIHSGIQVRFEAWNEHNERTGYRTESADSQEIYGTPRDPPWRAIR